MNLADLYVRLRAEGVADVVADLRAAGDAFGALARAAGTSVDAVAQSARAMRTATAELGLLGLSMLWTARRVAELASQEELALLRWRAVLGEQAEAFFAAVRAEAERTGYFLGDFSTMLAALLPAQQLVREDMETFLQVLRAVNEALLLAGVSAEQTRYAWYALAKAAVEGSADFLLEGTRFLHAQIVQGERAAAILREMNKELGVTQNLRIILRAILASERPTWEATQQVIESHTGQLRRLGGVMREVAEAIGRGALQVQASLAKMFAGWMERLRESGALPGVGRFLALGGLAAALAGLPVVLERVSSFLGRILGLGDQARWAFLRLAAALAITGLVMEDVWMSLQGKPSLFQVLWRWLGIEEAVTRLPEEVKWLLTAAIGYLTWQLSRYVVAHPGVLLKLGGAALITLGLVIGLEPLFRLLPGYEETLGQLIGGIPAAIQMALVAAGFALLGGKLAGFPGALAGAVIGIALTLAWGLFGQNEQLHSLLRQIPDWIIYGMTLAGFTLLGLTLGGPIGAMFGFTVGVALNVVWSTRLRRETTWADVEAMAQEEREAIERAAQAAGPVEAEAVPPALRERTLVGPVPEVTLSDWAQFGMELERAVADRAQYERALAAFATALSAFVGAMRAVYGEPGALYAGAQAAAQALRAVKDLEARQRILEDVLRLYAWPEDAVRWLREQANAPQALGTEALNVIARPVEAPTPVRPAEVAVAAAARPVEVPVVAEPVVVEVEATARPVDVPVLVGPVPLQVEAFARPVEVPTVVKPVEVEVEATAKPVEVPVVAKPTEVEVKAAARPVEVPVVAKPVEVAVEAVARPVEVPVVAKPVEVEATAKPAEVEVKATARPVEVPVIVGPVPLPVEVMARSVEVPVIVKPAEVEVEAAARPVEVPVVAKPVEVEVEAITRPVEVPVIVGPAPLAVEAVARPVEAPGGSGGRGEAPEPIAVAPAPARGAPVPPSVSVHVHIAEGAVRVEGKAQVPEDVKEEIIYEAVRAVEEGLRAALEEEVR